MNDLSASSQIAYRAALAQPRVVRRIRGLSDRALAWLFITPTMVLLLAINIFPLIWTIRLSFTSFRANRPNAPLRWLGCTRGLALWSSQLDEYWGTGVWREPEEEQ